MPRLVFVSLLTVLTARRVVVRSVMRARCGFGGFPFWEPHLQVNKMVSSFSA